MHRDESLPADHRYVQTGSGQVSVNNQYNNCATKLYTTENSSAVTVSIFGYAVSFRRFFNKNRGSRSFLDFTVPDFNHVQSKH